MPVRLADLVPPAATVTVGGHELAVYPLTLADIAGLMRRFDGLANLLGAAEVVGDPAPAGDALAQVLAAGTEAVAAVIAAGLRDPEAEAAVLRFGAVEQTALLVGIIDLTLPTGDRELGEFAARVVGVAARSGSFLRTAALVAGLLQSRPAVDDTIPGPP